MVSLSLSLHSLLLYLCSPWAWTGTDRVPLQGQSPQLTAQTQVLDLHKIVHIVALQVQHLQTFQHADLTEVRDVVVGHVQLLQRGERGDPIQVGEAAADQPEDLQVGKSCSEVPH